MTLIAALMSVDEQGRRSSVLLGDALLTTDRPGDESIELMLPHRRVPLRASPEKQFYPYRLRQKLVVISERLALAYAGNYDDAVHLFRTIEACRVETEQDLKSVLDEFDRQQKRRAAVIGIIRGADGKAGVVSNDAPDAAVYTFGDESKRVVVAGSGTRHLAETVGKLTLSEADAHQPLMVAWSLMAHLYSLERRTDFGLETDGFGGVYDILVPNENGFERPRCNLLLCKVDLGRRTAGDLVHMRYWSC